MNCKHTDYAILYDADEKPIKKICFGCKRTWNRSITKVKELVHA